MTSDLVTKANYLFSVTACRFTTDCWHSYWGRTI